MSEEPQESPEPDDILDPPVPAAATAEEGEHPPAPEEGTQEPAPADQVEPRLSFEEFLTLHGQLASRSTSVQKATQAALQRWMQGQRLDPQGYYSQADWAQFYDLMLTHA
jgi:hypothetical protein